MIPSSAFAGETELYSQGFCHVFALALHREFGWEMHLILDQSERYWEDPQDPDNWIPSVAHAYAVDGHGTAWDVLGARPLSDAQEEAAVLFLLREPDGDCLRSEADLAAWCGCWGLDGEGNPIDRPLERYGDDDVAEALDTALRVLSTIPGFPFTPAETPTFPQA